jgi:hypothetical protein
MPAAAALIAMATERGCTAASDGVEDLDLRPGQRLSIAIQESTAAPLNDIGHLPGWSRHHSSLQAPSSF